MAEITTRAAITTQAVNFPGHGVTLAGFLARPSQPGPRRAIIVIQEWWGLTDHIKDITQRFAREGLVAVAPDLYSRLGHKVTKDGAEAAKLMQALQSQDVLKDLNATVAYLKRQPFVDPVKIGVVGFCMGGTYALMMASHNSDIKASVAFYGQVPPTDSLKALLSPILFIHGSQDTWITKTEAVRLEQGLKQFGRPGQVVHYPHAGHAFFNDTRPEVYKADDAKDAWRRALDFFRTHLR